MQTLKVLNQAGNQVRNFNLEIDLFTRAYIECALWSSTDNSNEQGGDPLNKNYNWTHLADETLAKMIADCAKFQADNAKLLCVSQSKNSTEGGHCFWLSRNGHGSGLFDSEHFSLDARDMLQAAVESYGEFNLYVGDDGKIYS